MVRVVLLEEGRQGQDFRLAVWFGMQLNGGWMEGFGGVDGSGMEWVDGGQTGDRSIGEIFPQKRGRGVQTTNEEAPRPPSLSLAADL